MPTPTPPLPVEYINQYLELSDESASGLVWKARPPRTRVKVGSIAGSRTYEGYWRVKAGGRECRAHRIVYYLAVGEDPVGLEIDHKDRDPGNNHPSNLRMVDPSAQQRNRKKQSRRTSDYRGVSRRANGKRFARCCVWLEGGTLSATRHEGTCDTEEEAWAEVLRHRPEFRE